MTTTMAAYPESAAVWARALMCFASCMMNAKPAKWLGDTKHPEAHHENSRPSNRSFSRYIRICMSSPCSVLLRRDCKKPWLLKVPTSWLVAESASGVVTGKFVSRQLIPHCHEQTRLTRTDRKVLIMDSASGHTTPASRAQAKTFQLAVIPGGITQFSQPADMLPR
jgi:hypothetical protein